MFDVVGVILLVLLAAGFGWLARRAWRSQYSVVRWGAGVVAGLLALASTAGILLASVGFYRLTVPPHRYPVPAVTVARTPDQISRGARFAPFCALCHSPTGTGPLIGRDFGEGGPPFGALYAPNITPGGEIKDWSDGEVIRAIREGVHQSGRPLVIMPSEVFHHLSDTDVQAIVAYLRAQAAVLPATPPTRLNALAAIFVGSGVFRTSAQAPITQPVVAPVQGPSAEYGRYLVSILGCAACHGENLAGRVPGGLGPPAGPNLTLAIPRWTREQFVHTLRTGVNPYGHTLKQEMPWQVISAFAGDEDLQAIYAYLHELPPLQGPVK
jgi:mono/diheme cytochrome c family protein